MTSIEEIWAQMSDVAILNAGKLNWDDYNREMTGILKKWRDEILEAAAKECDHEVRVLETDGKEGTSEAVAFASIRIRKLKDKP